VVRDKTPALLIEVKWGDQGMSPNFWIFEKHFPGIEKIQIVGGPQARKDLFRGDSHTQGTQLACAVFIGMTAVMVLDAADTPILKTARNSLKNDPGFQNDGSLLNITNQDVTPFPSKGGSRSAVK